MPALSSIRFSRLLLTGAAGALGRELRPRLKAYCDTLRVSDLAEMEPAGAGEEVVRTPLEDRAAMVELLRGVDGVHLDADQHTILGRRWADDVGTLLG